MSQITTPFFSELTDGIEVRNAEGEVLGKSKKIAYRAIPEVVVSRIFMAIPFMVSAPLIMEKVSKTAFYQVSFNFLILKFK